MDDRIKKKTQEQLLDVLLEVDRVCECNGLTYFLIGGTLLGSVRHGGFIPWDDDVDIAMPRKDFEILIKNSNKYLDKNFYLDYRTTNKKYWLSFAKIRMKNTAYLESSVKSKLENDGFWVDIFPLDYTANNKKSHLKLKKKIIKILSSILFNGNSKTIMDVSGYKKILFIIISLLPHEKLFSARNRIMQSENSKEEEYFVNYGSQYAVNRQVHSVKEILPTKKAVFNDKLFSIPKNPDYVLKNIYGLNYMQLPPKEKQITHNPKYIKFADGEEVFFNE